MAPHGDEAAGRDEPRGWNQVTPLDQEGAEARERGLPHPHGTEGEIRRRHAIHSRLNRRRLEISHTRRPAPAPADELEVLTQVPSVGVDPSFRLASLFALEGAELLHQVRERLRHDAGPPARATATFSPRPNIRRHRPGVNSGLGVFGRPHPIEESGLVREHGALPLLPELGAGAEGSRGCIEAGAPSRRLRAQPIHRRMRGEKLDRRVLTGASCEFSASRAMMLIL